MSRVALHQVNKYLLPHSNNYNENDGRPKIQKGCLFIQNGAFYFAIAFLAE